MSSVDPPVFIEEDVVVRRTPGGVILAVLISAGLVVGMLGVGLTTFIVSVSQTEQGLCGGFGVPCTSLSVERVSNLSGLSLPAGTVVTGAYYNHTSTSTKFWASVQLPSHPSVSLAAYQPYGTPMLDAELSWAKRVQTLVYLGKADGDTVHSVISGVNRAGQRELFLSFSTGS